MKGVLKVTLYYAVGLGVLWLLTEFVPGFGDVLRETAAGRNAALDGEITSTFGGTPLAEESVIWWGGETGTAALSMIATLLIMMPVVSVYTMIKRKEGYDESVVHALLILPVAVTGIVMIVKSSVALAFSLAGIVAAVRFRTTLDDTKDAVYIFLAIGVGLACGVQAPGVALVLSVIFNGVNLFLWRTGFGNIYVDAAHGRGGLGLGDVLAGPESAASAVTVGDTQLLSALSEKELVHVAERVARMERYLDAESDTKKDRKEYNVLLVHASELGQAQTDVEAELEESALRWRLAEIIPGADGVSILEYLVRLHDHCSPGGLLDDLKRSEAVKAAEIRSLKGLKRKR